MPPSNQDDFDGYRKWLGVTSKKRPPTHYELLGIMLDEDDSDVIRAATTQRRSFVESKRGEGHDSLVAEILYRIGEAEVTLLNPTLRRDYDRQQELFEKRRKNRQVDPNASRSRFRSRPGRTVGEDGGIVKTFVGIMAVVCVGFGVMAWFSFQLPWAKKADQRAEPNQLAANNDQGATPANINPTANPKTAAIERPSIGDCKPITTFKEPAFQKWMAEVAKMPVEKQIDAVVEKLKELNPGFDGKLTGDEWHKPSKIENGVVTELTFSTEFVVDISPVRALPSFATCRRLKA